MSISTDNFTLWLALAFSIAGVVAYFAIAVRGTNRQSGLARFARGAYLASFACAAYACVYLMQAILSGQRFDIAYVLDNSSLRDSLLYRVSALWADQQGSLLLWAFFVGLIGMALTAARGRNAAAACFWCAFQAFLLLLLVVEDPFAKLPDFSPGLVGKGLSPLLKNPWMAIHPPVVFLGYALLVVPAALAIGALIEGDAQAWAAQCAPWALGGWVFLGAGIGMGMIWAYQVQGWGGYWSWDPVENASLIPWLLSTALVHGLVLARNRKLLLRGSVGLALATLLSILYASYLTRSGILANVSVHSFTETSAAAYLKWCSILFGVVCVAALAVGWKRLAVAGSRLAAVAWASKDLAIICGIGVVVLLAAVVTAGTTYPLVARGKIGPEFYTRMSAVIGILIAALIAGAAVVRWGGGRRRTEHGLGLWSVVTALAVVTVLALAIGLATLAIRAWANWMRFWLGPASVKWYAGAAAVLTLLVGCAVVALAAAVWNAARSAWRRSGAHVAHAGAALLILGIVFSTMGSKVELTLVKDGTPTKAFGREFSYFGRKTVGDREQVVDVRIGRGAEQVKTPIIIMTGSDGSSTMVPHILSSLAGDVYLSPQRFQITTVTPMLFLSNDRWFPTPVGVPRGASSISLVGMTVESQEAELEYQAPGKAAAKITVSAREPASIDGYTFAFAGFVSDSEHGAHNVGVELAVTGHGLNEIAMLEVSTKPLVYLVWVGCVLVLVGGVIAVARRRAERGK